METAKTKQYINSQLKVMGTPINEFYRPKYGRYDFNAGKENAYTCTTVDYGHWDHAKVFTDEEGVTRVVPQSDLVFAALKVCGYNEMPFGDDEVRAYQETLAHSIHKGIYAHNDAAKHYYAVRDINKKFIDESGFDYDKDEELVVAISEAMVLIDEYEKDPKGFTDTHSDKFKQGTSLIG